MTQGERARVFPYDLNLKKMHAVSPSMGYTAPLDEWQSAARAKLAALLGMDKFEKVEPELQIEFTRQIPGATELRFTFRSEGDYRVPCHLWLPDGVSKPPVMICLQGHSNGMHISLGRQIYPNDLLDGDRDFVVRAVKEGYAAISLEQRNFGECGGDEKGTHCFKPSMMALMLGRTTVGERVWDVCRLIDLLEADFAEKLDLSRLCCMGNSGGGTTTVYVAALDERIKLAMPSASVSTYADSIGAMKHCVCNYVPGIALNFEMSDLIAMICPRYYIQVNGETDPIFPVTGGKKVFEAGKKAYLDAGCPERCALVIGDGGHRMFADRAWPIVHEYLD